MFRPHILFASVALASLVAAAQAHAADEFYKGKTVTIVVGFSPGGGYDTNARAIARHLGNHIPGKPNVIVQNQPGAGSLNAVRALDATATKDGTVLTVFNPGLVTQSVVTPDKVKVDFRKVAWIGVVTPDFRVCYGFGPNGIKSWDDLMHRTASKPFILGSTAKGAGNYINGATLREVFGAHVKQILGFPGSAEQRLAIERGELDGDCGSWSSIPQDWIDNHKIHPFVRFTEKRPAEIPESAVYVGKFAKTAEQQQLLDVLNAADDIGRPFIMSKSVPADRIAIMRHAFAETMKDKGFLSDAKKQELPVNPIGGEEAEKIVAKMYNVPAKIVAKAKAIYE
jgi:tripartite-type tricarboxylate transporter receptor subunit TctC